MKNLLEAGVLIMALAGALTTAQAQASAPGKPAVSAQQEAATAAGSAVPPANRTDKQLALQAQTDRLVAMATELRDQVDKTNKNILSIKVVRKAEEIEQFAKRLKEQAKR